MFGETIDDCMERIGRRQRLIDAVECWRLDAGVPRQLSRERSHFLWRRQLQGSAAQVVAATCGCVQGGQRVSKVPTFILEGSRSTFAHEVEPLKREEWRELQ